MIIIANKLSHIIPGESPLRQFLQRVALLSGLWALSSCTPVQPPAGLATPYLPIGFCYVDEAAPSVQVDLKYAGNDNFVGRPIDGYRGRRALLRRDAAEALRKASDILRQEGYGLLVWDAYRPMRALRDFRAWSRTPDTSTRAEFYPRLTKQGIYDGRYIGDSSEHTWGIAVDITLTDLATGKPIDMGGRHDLLDPSSATDSPEVTPAQRANRHRLRRAMRAVGFANYPKEWWHYRLSDSQPWVAYDFPLNDDMRVSPHEDARQAR